MRGMQNMSGKMAAKMGMGMPSMAVTLAPKPTEQEYTAARHGNMEAKAKVLKFEETRVQAEAMVVSSFRRFVRSDPAKMATVVWDRLKEEIKSPDSMYWQAVKIGQAQHPDSDGEKGAMRLIRRRMITAAFSEVRLADNRTVSMDPNMAANAFDNAHIDAMYIARLGMLNSEDRMMTYLRLVESWTYDKIASVSGMGETTVRDRIARAIDMIRKMSGGSMD